MLHTLRKFLLHHSAFFSKSRRFIQKYNRTFIIKIIQKRYGIFCETFRKDMKTEEAHRIKTAVETLKEEITELGQSA